MRHLTEHELSAMLDEAIEPQARAQHEAHLESCEACRVALADLAAQDHALVEAVVHDPGDAYFESFAERVEQRIRKVSPHAAPAHGRAATTGSARRTSRGWFGWPRSFGWVGAAAVVLVGSGVAFLVSREGGAPNLRNPALSQRAEQAEERRSGEPAAKVDDLLRNPPPAASKKDGAAGSLEQEHRTPPAAPLGAARAPEAANETARPAPQGRLQEAVRDAQGDELPAERAGESSFATPPREEKQVQGLAKPGARPLANEPRAEAPKRSEAAAPAPPPAVSTEKNRESKESAPAAKDAPAATEDTRGTATPSPHAKSSIPTAVRDAVSRVKSTIPAPTAVPEPKPETPTALTSPATKAKAPASARTLAGGNDSVPRQVALPEGKPGARATRRDAAADADAVAASVCGTIEDHAGRPIAGARVVFVDHGESVASDETGRYCIDASRGEHSLAVFAIGFVSARREVRAGAGASDADFVLAAISVMDKVYAYRAAEPDPFQTWPDDAKGPARRAQERARLAAKARSAMLYDQAATDWERAVLATIGSAVESQARFALADARVAAWEIDPTDEHRQGARASLEAYLAGAPQGLERDVAMRWLERVKP